MNKTTIISTVILSLGVLTAWYVVNLNSISEPVTKNLSVVTVDKVTYDFGRIDIFAGKVQTDYVLVNTGEQDVVVTSAITSCMCTEGEIGGMTFGMHSGSRNITIPAGGSETLTATYDPLAHGPNGVGKVKRELALTTNSDATPDILVTFTADVYKE